VKVLRNSGCLACWRLATRSAPQAAPPNVRGERAGCLVAELTEPVHQVDWDFGRENAQRKQLADSSA